MINMMVGVNHVTDGLFRPTSHQFVDVRTENNRPKTSTKTIDGPQSIAKTFAKLKDKEELFCFPVIRKKERKRKIKKKEYQENTPH